MNRRRVYLFAALYTALVFVILGWWAIATLLAWIAAFKLTIWSKR